MEFFHDECRCPVYVRDVVKIILALTNRWLSGNNLVSMLLLKAEISSKLREDSSAFFFYMVLQLVFLVKKLENREDIHNVIKGYGCGRY